MSLDVSVMAFKHEHHLQHLHDTLGMFGYREVGERAKVCGDNELSEQMRTWDLGNKRVLKAIAPCPGWTVVYDPEKTMVYDSKSCQEFSRKHSSGVVGMICEGPSQTYGFAVYENGEKIREFLSVGGAVKTNFGKELSPEIGLNLSDKTMIDDEIFDIFLGVTGVDLYTLLENGEFSIKELEKTGGVAKSSNSILEKMSPLKLWE